MGRCQNPGRPEQGCLGTERQPETTWNCWESKGSIFNRVRQEVFRQGEFYSVAFQVLSVLLGDMFWLSVSSSPR